MGCVGHVLDVHQVPVEQFLADAGLLGHVITVFDQPVVELLRCSSRRADFVRQLGLLFLRASEQIIEPAEHAIGRNFTVGVPVIDAVRVGQIVQRQIGEIGRHIAQVRLGALGQFADSLQSRPIPAAR